MRKTTRTGSFFLVLLFNIMLNFRLTVPGWVLLVLHFIIPQFIKWWYCLVYFGAFLLYMIVWMLILWGLGAWASSVPPTPRVKNKNPYSVQTNEIKKTVGDQNPYSATSSALPDPIDTKGE